MPIPLHDPLAPPIITPPGVSGYVIPGPTMTLIGANGDELDLTLEEGYVVLPGLEGIDAPPWSLQETNPWAWDGGQVNDVRSTIREGFIPVYLEGPDQDDAGFRERKRRLHRLLNPRTGPISWRLTYADGYTRTLVGRYVPQGDTLTADSPGIGWQTIGIPLRAHDPFWQGDPIRSRLQASSSDKAFISEDPAFDFFPIILSSSQVIGAPFEVINPGDVEAFPVWTVHGPGNDLTITNVDTGESFTLTGALVDTDVITIDARRGVLTVTDQDGVSLFGRLGANPDLFAIPAGVSVLSIELDGVTTGAYVQLDYVPRYLTGA